MYSLCGPLPHLAGSAKPGVNNTACANPCQTTPCLVYSSLVFISIPFINNSIFAIIFLPPSLLLVVSQTRGHICSTPLPLQCTPCNFSSREDLSPFSPRVLASYGATQLLEAETNECIKKAFLGLVGCTRYICIYSGASYPGTV